MESPDGPSGGRLSRRAEWESSSAERPTDGSPQESE